MEFISIKQAMQQESGDVELRGWCYRERKSNKMAFIVLRDSSGIIQCVFGRGNFDEDTWNTIDSISIETSLEIKGTIKKDERAPTGYEISACSIRIVGECDTYPITKDQSPEFLLDKRHLWIRSRKLTSIMKIRSKVLGLIHEFYRSKGFFEFSPPIFTPNACEGGSTLFSVKYYDTEVYLTQSWQLYAEAAIFGLERIYTTSPSFRAEKSKTSRHLSEFWMSEMECAWLKLDDVIQIAKEFIKFIFNGVALDCRDDLEVVGRDPQHLIDIASKDFPTITYTHALNLLAEKKDMKVEWGKDLRTIEEEKLMELYDTPVIVTDYPKEVMAFYKPLKHEKSDAPDPVALCFDMLAPDGYGEIIGGSERESDLKELRKALKKEGENIENYEWYLDLRRYGSVPHSGFGMGVERVIAWICGLDNIKDAIGFPRTMLRWKP